MERKEFLKTLSMAGISVSALLSACNTTSTTDVGGGGPLEGDAGLVQQAAQREAVAIQTYTAVVESGLLEQAVADTARLYRSHHRQHLVEFNNTLVGLDGEAIILENFSADQRISGVNNQEQAVELAMVLEMEAAQAYFTRLVNDLQGSNPRQIFGDIFPIEVSHFIRLRATLGRQPAINSPFFSDLTPE